MRNRICNLSIQVVKSDMTIDHMTGQVWLADGLLEHFVGQSNVSFRQGCMI